MTRYLHLIITLLIVSLLYLFLPSKNRSLIDAAPILMDSFTNLVPSEESEQAWEHQRAQFLEDRLKISQQVALKIAELRSTQSLIEEGVLNDQSSDFEKHDPSKIAAVQKNRQKYEMELKALLGPEHYDTYTSYYWSQWKSRDDLPLLPLK